MRFQRFEAIRKTYTCRDSEGRICGTLAYGRDADGVLWIQDGSEYVRFRKGSDVATFNAVLRRRADQRRERADRENARIASDIRRAVAGRAGWDSGSVPNVPIGRLAGLVAKGA